MTTSVTGATPPHAAPHRERHPTALPTLFFTEMWERFSYYGMRALLVLYLVNALGYQRSDALAIYGTYTALVYLTPIDTDSASSRAGIALVSQVAPVRLAAVMMDIWHVLRPYEINPWGCRLRPWY